MRCLNFKKTNTFVDVFCRFFVPLPPEMEQFQFAAIVLMTLLTLKLLLLPVRFEQMPVVNNSRWLMACAMSLLSIQFLLQYMLHLRALGVTQAVMLNLAMFIPCSYLISVAVLLLQRQGHLTRLDKHIGWITWVVAMALMVTASIVDGKSLLADSQEKYWAEVAASGCYALMTFYYGWRHLSNLRIMRNTLQNYYDQDMNEVLRWMQYSIIIILSFAVGVPILIFGTGKIVAIFGLLFFACIFYLVENFSNYVVSKMVTHMREAEENEESAEQFLSSKEDEADDEGSSQLSPETVQRVEHYVQLWLQKGNHLQNGMKLPGAAAGIGVPQYQLKVWLKQKGLKYSEWITELRINEAKRNLVEHPEWSNETVAMRSGFNDRSYFQTIFKKKTGLTPAEFIQTTTH